MTSIRFESVRDVVPEFRRTIELCHVQSIQDVFRQIMRIQNRLIQRFSQRQKVAAISAHTHLSFFAIAPIADDLYAVGHQSL